ncbi:MAG: ribosomal-processing cysteine protease Prp [Lachnospiraceae bacterium]|nr:ribosomal-processing cysteine protease Prp [Lachnospiraceae bacterium]
MIKISVYQDERGRANGFHCLGHAGYAENGHDIVCAAVSALTMTAVNSVESLTGDTFSYDEDEKEGMMDFKIASPMSDAAALLMGSLFLGLSMIEESYGRKFIRIE